ncbi:G-type lectin S-receptor-like serine/threonine-kinase [Trifolium pratense]|uniref:G-type lectin S-receptor-like serine/threonine-kinase n=1 Tax=Trifolium pratense TaxID=57577 RepID=A0A2K3LTD7_TRIPR|nr:G-type lectin S-receptor-like serine/threonine-kinase [Trifolium pratense]
MARIFGSTENEGSTKRIVGTYGYMSPEYVMGGLFSEKSDVFSFGVLLLEIISGRKNTSFHNHEEALSLLGYAWKLWNEEEIVTLIDPEICNPDYVENIMRCIHIGLLCVQEIATERPTMATVVSMLNSEIVKFPRPFQPAFILRQTERRGDIDQQCRDLNSLNIVSVTSLQGR